LKDAQNTHTHTLQVEKAHNISAKNLGTVIFCNSCQDGELSCFHVDDTRSHPVDFDQLLWMPHQKNPSLPTFTQNRHGVEGKDARHFSLSFVGASVSRGVSMGAAMLMFSC